jgi:hypothetical protein
LLGMTKVSDHNSPSLQFSPEQGRGGCDIRVIRGSQKNKPCAESRMAELPVRLRTSLRRHYPHQVQGVSSPSFANDFFDDLTSPAKLELDSQPRGSPALSFSLRIRRTRVKSINSSGSRAGCGVRLAADPPSLKLRRGRQACRARKVTER